jgi:hypothetical protein
MSRTSNRDLHFDLRWLGPAHETEAYTLHIGAKRYPLVRHTGATAVGSPTHVAMAVAVHVDTPQLARVIGSNSPDGFPTLASIAIHITGDSGFYTHDDVAKAVLFMNPTLTMLTTASAQTVLGYIGSNCQPVSTAIAFKKSKWCQPVGVFDDAGNPIRKKDGTQFYTYELDETVLNNTGTPSLLSKALIYSDASLEGTRWKLLPGVSVLDMNVENAASAARRSAEAPGARTAVGDSDGYHLAVQDGGPNYGCSVSGVKINRTNTKKGGAGFTIDLTITNSYIRHTSVFVSFMKADGVTPMTVTDKDWLLLLAGSPCWPLVDAYLSFFSDGKPSWLGGDTLKFIGKVGAESTFLGIPVSSANVAFQFGLPEGDHGPVGKIRVLVGSLGVSSGNDCDPTAAWFGLALTALIDLAIPTYALLLTAGVETNAVFDKMFKDTNLLLPIAGAVFTAVGDLFTHPDKVDKDISGLILTLANALIKSVLTKPDVLAALAAYFGAEEAEEAIPFVGWAFKAVSLAATALQIGQTVGEIVGSPRVVEFDLTVTMDAQITLVPDGEFPQTATTYTITAQYTGNTTRTYVDTVTNPKVTSIVAKWNDVPVGGKVSFVVAMFDKNGWGVGKGQTGTFDNVLNGPIFTAQVTVKQQLYPLTAQSTYQHRQLLQYDANHNGYHWVPTTQAPTATAENLLPGPDGGLEGLGNITLTDDLGVLGYVWLGSGSGMPPPAGANDGGDPELYTMSNIRYRPLAAGGDYWPDAGYMTAPAGYSGQPILLYARTAPGGGAGPRFFFLDPSGEPDTGYHLREVKPVTDPNVPMSDPRRQFVVATGKSWGRFAMLPTAMAIHSNGYVVGVNPSADTMLILRLPAAASADKDAPWASAPVEPGTITGRLQSPALAAIRPDQTILVLESGNQRVQAFSGGGHPVMTFGKRSWFPLVSHASGSDSVDYLSMTVDVANYVYVLSQTGNGYAASQFNLDVYTPTGQPLFYRQGLVLAGGMVVDLWRNLYALNFQQIAGPGGRPEPSISEWIPSTP